MAIHKEATVKKATSAAAPKKATKVKKIVVIKKAPTNTKKSVATPVVVDAIAQEGTSQPQTIIHPDAPWPFKKAG